MTAIEFIQEKIKDADNSAYKDTDWADAVSIENWITQWKEMWPHITDVPIADVEIEYDPAADFQYFVSRSARHDGTLIFVIETEAETVGSIFTGSFYYAPNGSPNENLNKKIKYTVGDMVVLNEFDEDGKRFAPVEKPWMRERTSVFIPVKQEYI